MSKAIALAAGIGLVAAGPFGAVVAAMITTIATSYFGT